MKLVRGEYADHGGADVRRLARLVEEAEATVGSLTHRIGTLRRIRRYVAEDVVLMQPGATYNRTLARGAEARKQSRRLGRDLTKARAILAERRQQLTDALADEARDGEVCDG